MDIQDIVTQNYKAKLDKAKQYQLELEAATANPTAVAGAVSSNAGNDGYQSGAGSYQGLFSEGIYNLRHAFTGGERRAASAAEAANSLEQEQYKRNQDTLENAVKIKSMEDADVQNKIAQNTAREKLQVLRQAADLQAKKKEQSATLKLGVDNGLLAPSVDGTGLVKTDLFDNAKFADLAEQIKQVGGVDYSAMGVNQDNERNERNLTATAEGNLRNTFGNAGSVNDAVTKATTASPEQLARYNAAKATIDDAHAKTMAGLSFNGVQQQFATDYERIDPKLNKLTVDPMDEVLALTKNPSEARGEANRMWNDNKVGKALMKDTVSSDGKTTIPGLSEPEARIVFANILRNTIKTDSEGFTGWFGSYAGNWADSKFKEDLEQAKNNFNNFKLINKKQREADLLHKNELGKLNVQNAIALGNAQLY